MKEKWNRISKSLCLIVILGLVIPSLAMAGFNMPGYDLEVIKSEQGVTNAAVSFQTNSVWIDLTPDKPYSFGTGFVLPDANEIIFARLYLNVWGGSNEYTCQIDTTVNGNAIDVVNIGGLTDTNPTYDPNQTCVYGSGYGTWQVAYSGVAELLNLDGTNNTVDVNITDDANDFDGRTVDVTLMVVYRDYSIDHAIDYYLAEADGYMRRSPGTPNSPAERILDINSINTSDIIEATYTAYYTHGTNGQFDRLYFNGTQLDGNDVAVGAMGKYGPDVLTYDIADVLLSDSTVLYTVDEAVVGSPSEYSLRAKIGILEISRPYCTELISGDVNNDCRIDFIDFAIMASNWLECNLEPQSACWE